MNEETALKPDQANEDDSKVEGTLLAFTPGQLSKLFSLKNVATLSRVCSRRFHRPSGEEQEGRGDTPAPDAKLGSEVIKE
ncbi:hypothetical protein N658DRAFT_491009 [Parathielavia hyrcaniae]|uniref:Uncharacterized protein n=1 Tax=Parathielavia hyrcaniae TaxID=113614 RepID=A0AAN6T6T7_9PEZI|nr:hypothetical protein N658DRAFT_491009 [Parathielavia hyrcaniae]